MNYIIYAPFSETPTWWICRSLEAPVTRGQRRQISRCPPKGEPVTAKIYKNMPEKPRKITLLIQKMNENDDWMVMNQWIWGCPISRQTHLKLSPPCNVIFSSSAMKRIMLPGWSPGILQIWSILFRFLQEAPPTPPFFGRLLAVEISILRQTSRQTFTLPGAFDPWHVVGGDRKARSLRGQSWIPCKKERGCYRWYVIWCYMMLYNVIWCYMML